MSVRGGRRFAIYCAAMTRLLALVAAAAAAGCAPQLRISEVEPAASGLRLPDWTEPWNGDTLVVAGPEVLGMAVTSRPSRTRAIVRVRYRWTLTPLGVDYLHGLGCGRAPLTIASAEQAICDYAGVTHTREVEYLWDDQTRAWRAGALVGGEAPG